MADVGRRPGGPAIRAGAAAAVGGVAVVAAEVWAAPAPSWALALDLAAGLALVAAAAALLAFRATAAGWLLTAAALSWAAATIGLPAAGLNRAFLVHATMTDDLRRTRRTRALAASVAALGYVCAVPVVDALGWPWLVVAVGLAASTRARTAWLVVGPTVLLLTLRATAGLVGVAAPTTRVLFATAYGVAVLLAAAGSVAACRVGRSSRGRVVNRVVALAEASEEDQLQAALADAVRDPELAVSLDDGHVTIRSPVLDRDPALATAVAEVVRLAGANQLLRRGLDDQLQAIRGSSARLLAAADREAEALGVRLALGPRRRLARVGDLLGAIRDEDPQVAGRRARAWAHLTRADEGLAALGSGLAPDVAQAAELDRSITELAQGLHDQVEVSVATGDLPLVVARTVYFVCSEALANSAKHAGAEHVWVVVEGGERVVVAEIRDDGIGGADRDGSGLRGISDRVAALGGRLTLESAHGGGTVVRAEVPR